MRLSLPACILAAIILIASPASSVVYVKHDSPGPTFDGTSWDKAYHTVQSGIDAAVTGDEVWVAAGNYVECVKLKAGIALKGGYLGSGSTRDTTVYKTTLDAGNSSSGVVTVTGADGSSIDGFTIRGGQYRIKSSAASMSATGNIIIGNGTNGDYGIFCAGGASILSNNVFLRNTIGIYVEGGSPTISKNRISCEKIYGSQGIYAKSTTAAQIEANSIYEVDYGIGCWSNSQGNVVNNCVFATEKAVSTGLSSVAITNNTLVYNKTGIYSDNAPATAANNIVAFNTTGIQRFGPGLAESADFHRRRFRSCS